MTLGKERYEKKKGCKVRLCRNSRNTEHFFCCALVMDQQKLVIYIYICIVNCVIV